MSRLLAIIVICIVIFLLLKYYRRQTPKNNAGDKGASVPRENMVRCAHCGIHLPKGESITVDQKHFCSEVHRHAHIDESA
jgi:uncharacterized protein